jgi:hypothetical protein
MASSTKPVLAISHSYSITLKKLRKTDISSFIFTVGWCLDRWLSRVLQA